ncbi:MAG: hypothetical protein DID92_2727743999 [Candidatus Nitrotoga sp. SPKER]|nr:MAG: hypothetical protein DID92_2727743999 [Candidatus Nitrotoga sp. SPKER]
MKTANRLLDKSVEATVNLDLLAPIYLLDISYVFTYRFGLFGRIQNAHSYRQ